MRNDGKRTALLLLALVALGCEGKQPEKVDPSAQTPTTPEAKPQQAKPTKPPPKEFEAPAGWELKPLAVGQWIRLVVRTEAEPPAQTFLRVVGRESDGFWLEIESNTPNGTTVLQLLMDESARKDFKASSLKKLRVKAGQAPLQEYSGPMIAMVGSVVEAQVGLFGQPDPAKAQREDRAVAAGTFKGCFVHEVEGNVLGATTKTKSWNHPAVPIVGFVRSEGTVGVKKVVTELLEIHEDGAQSAIR